MENIKIFETKPKMHELLSIGNLIRENALYFPFFERLKTHLASSIFSLVCSRLTFNRFFILKIDDKIAGVCYSRKNRIRGLFISIRAQKRGLGKQLLIYVEDYLRKMGYKSVYLKFLKSNRDFYINLGYTQHSKIMIKEL